MLPVEGLATKPGDSGLRSRITAPVVTVCSPSPNVVCFPTSSVTTAASAYLSTSMAPSRDSFRPCTSPPAHQVHARVALLRVTHHGFTFDQLFDGAIVAATSSGTAGFLSQPLSGRLSGTAQGRAPTSHPFGALRSPAHRQSRSVGAILERFAADPLVTPGDPSGAGALRPSPPLIHPCGTRRSAVRYASWRNSECP